MTTAARIAAFAGARRLRAEIEARWQALKEADGIALLDLAEDLRLGANDFRDILEWAEEIAARDSSSIRTVLDAEEVRSARSRARGRNEKVKLVREALRRLRFPQLAAREAYRVSSLRRIALSSTTVALVLKNSRMRS